MLNRSPQHVEPYVSGFIGLPLFNERSAVQERRLLISPHDVIRVSDVVVDERIHSELIDELMGSFRTAQVLSRANRAFHEFLEESVRLMAVNTLNDWILIQEQSPYFSQSHCEFVEDTIRFIMTGKRTLRPLSWQFRLRYHHAKVTAKRYQVNRDLFFGRRNGLADILPQWLSQEGGISDFMTSMSLIYGSALKQS